MNLNEFIENHLKLLAKGDARKLVESDYHDNAIMILMVGDKPQIISGKEALTSLFDTYLKMIYRGFVSFQKLIVSDDAICLEATINTVGGPAKVWDALSMKDGKIFRHFSGQK